MEETVDNAKIAHVLNQIAEMLEFKDENTFKVRSYRMAAENIGAMQNSVAEMAAQGGGSELQKISGIGKSISSQIIEIIETGRSAYLEELAREIPLTVLDLRRVSGIGLKTAQALYRDFGIKDLDQLRSFAEGGGLRSAPGIGEKSSERIVRSLDRLQGRKREEG
jgi:DNA polymerase (family 10)